MPSIKSNLGPAKRGRDGILLCGPDDIGRNVFIKGRTVERALRGDPKGVAIITAALKHRFPPKDESESSPS